MQGVLTVCSGVSLAAATLPVHADTPIFALPDTFRGLFLDDIDITAIMLLYSLILHSVLPFELQCAVVTGKIVREAELFALNWRLSAAAGKRAVWISRVIQREEYFKV